MKLPPQRPGGGWAWTGPMLGWEGMEASVTPRVSVLLLALLCVWALPGVALGSDGEAPGSTFQRRLERAEQLYELLEYEKALNWLSQAKQVASTIEEQVQVALYRGIVLADLGRRKQALEAFRAGLSLRPESGLPVQVAPKVHRDFEAVRKQVLRKQASTATSARTARKPAEEPAPEPPEADTSPAPVAEKPAAPAPTAPAPAEAAAAAPKSQTLSDLRTRLGATGAEVGKSVGSSLGSALDSVLGTSRPSPPAQQAPAESTAKDEP